ncbi:cell division protein ZapE [Aquibium sp. A9E412]|uniref:cell division protein ZapE n=1 Tax=Aquibium sp. A9E412 TaxID=2976767 RepID=UPI0025B0DF30|nr:cell division protein ZapE [Aquibium sp. A9E412]MDN2565688.1 cell division protein ZapE [Aquibium sp. A9E412]
MALRDAPATHPTVLERYLHLVERGALARDPAQVEAAKAFDRLIDDIVARRLARKSSALGWLFARRRPGREPVEGLYVHGGVGRGKTMLMDIFFTLLPVERKRRVHFNDFMADVHDRIARHRAAVKAGEAREDDPIPPVARAIAREAWVLCFDEFSVADIADAMILSRLFSALFEEGVALAATSNVAPDDLYRDGLNRGLFEPFIALLKRHARVLRLAAATDYRLEKLSRLPVYMTPLGPEADRQMDAAWAAATEGMTEAPASVTVKGRKVRVPRAAGQMARFSFADLCEKPLAARDYLALAERYDTVFIDGVPVLDDGQRNAAKRFILLIDTLYDKQIRLVMSAAAEPDALYRGRTGNEAFEFRRTASRIAEMRSHGWGVDSAAAGDAGTAAGSR